VDFSLAATLSLPIAASAGGSELFAALLGAGVGGATSLMASLITERRKLSRNTRIKMYRDILPDVEKALP